MTLKSYNWDLLLGMGVGPLRFGMSTDTVVTTLGPFAQPLRVHGEMTSGFHNGDVYVGSDFLGDRLSTISFAPMGLGTLMFQGQDLLAMPTLDVVRLFADLNGGIAEAQGGSLYFETLRLGLMQYETSSAREVMLCSPEAEMHEPLHPVTIDYVADYYRDQRAGEWSETDLFGEVQTLKR